MSTTPILLNEEPADLSPFDQFNKWFRHALMNQVQEPEAMILSTVDDKGKPSSRVVLMRSLEENGFVFFTNYKSRKGAELSANPNVSALFFWQMLGRQVRIAGVVEKITAEESDAYFAMRPRMSQIGAWASNQSEAMHSRTELETRFDEFSKQFRNADVPRPPHWGGYRILPSYFEFWHGRDSRLHDRVSYNRAASGEWNLQLLYP